jgi:hypothetical protein
LFLCLIAVGTSKAKIKTWLTAQGCKALKPKNTGA